MSVATANSYKATFIFDMRGYEEPVETLIERVKDVITQIGGTVGEVKDMGVRDFAYITQKNFTQAPYVQVFYTGDSTTPAILKEKLRLDKQVVRCMVQSA